MSQDVQNVVSSAKPRAWYLLHASTWLALLLATGVLALIEIPGRRESFSTYAHGWPLAYAKRDYLLGPATASATGFGLLQTASSTRKSQADWTAEQQQAWANNDVSWELERQMTPWSTAGTIETSWFAAEVNLAIAVGLLMLLGWTVERRRRKSTRGWLQFRLRTLLAGVTLLAIASSIVAGWHADRQADQRILDQLQERGNSLLPDFDGREINFAWRPPTYLPESVTKIAGVAELFERARGFQIDGKLTDADLELLSRLPALSHLSMGFPQNESASKRPLRLPRFPALHRLWFGDSTEIRPNMCPAVEIDDMPQLEDLLVQGPVAVHLGNVPNLCTMNLRGVVLEGSTVRRIAGLPNLQSLTLDGVALKDSNRLAIDGCLTLRDVQIVDLAAIAAIEIRHVPMLESVAVSTNLNDLESLDFADAPRLKTITVSGGNRPFRLNLQGVENVREISVEAGVGTMNGPSMCWNQEILTRAKPLSIPGLARLRSLDKFRADWARPDAETLRDLDRLSTLTDIRLNGTRLTDAELARLPLANLVELQLASTDVTDGGINCLERAPRLTRLNVLSTVVSNAAAARLCRSHPGLHPVIGDNDCLPGSAFNAFRDEAVTSFEESIESVRSHDSAEIILDKTVWHSGGAEFLGDADLAKLDGLSGLKSLDLGNLHLTDDGLHWLAHLPDLQTLDSSHTRITDVGLKQLSALSRLESLALGDTAVSGTGLKSLAGLERLAVLDLSYADLTHEGIAQLKCLKHLEELHLCGIRLTDADLDELSALTDLKVLDLEDCDLSAADLSRLRGLGRLEALDLFQTDLTDEGLKSIAALSSLTELILSDNERLTDEGVKVLTGLTKLKRLALDGTNLTAAAIVRLKTIRSLSEVRLPYEGLDPVGEKELHSANPNLNTNADMDDWIHRRQVKPRTWVRSVPVG